MHIMFTTLVYANSLLHVSVLLGHPQGRSQVVHSITAVDGFPIVAGFLAVHTRNLCMCACVCVCSWLFEVPEN
jgi:hypothetical protein